LNPDSVPSPFPGLDPFIEGQCWSDFHTDYIAAVRAQIVPQVKPRYVAVIEERIYVERHEQPRELIRPDATLVRPPGSARLADRKAAPGASARPVPVPLPIPQTEREPYIELRFREGGEVVTVIEFLSPANKRGGSDGRREYLAKRETVLRSVTHLVEIDLLRGGEPLPMAAELPEAYGWVIVSAAPRRPIADVWPVQLQEPLPRIDVPLAGDDPPICLDLQAAFTEVYDRAGYDSLLSYALPLRPAVAENDRAFVERIVAQASDSSR
jgi:hypothetical protein